MPRWFSVVLGAACVLLTIFPLHSRAQFRTAAVERRIDLDDDGLIERVVLDRGKDPAISISRGGRVLWSGIPGKWQPWKLQIADVDGDGRLDIAIGVNKSTRFFPRPHNCLFIYGWDGRRAYPKWLGSSLSRPFTDFLFLKPRDGGAWPLMAAEIDKDTRRSIGMYAWNGFGFSIEQRFEDWRSERLIGFFAPRAGVGQVVALEP